MFDIIAFDADDTLWENESYYKKAEQKLTNLLAEYRVSEFLVEELLKTETRNIATYGYGIKSFTLSMIETAIELTEGKIAAGQIQKIVGFGKEMIATDVVLLKGVREMVQTLSSAHTLMIITKGDLFDQERKVARSGLGDFFKYVEIVSEKTSETYEEILAKYDIAPHCFLMIGNSLKSDVLPVVEIGGQAVYIPNSTTWVHEMVSEEESRKNSYHELEHLGQLPRLLDKLSER